MSYLDVLKQRRSVYHLSSNLEVSNEEIVKLVHEIIELSPTAFNMQSSRVVILFNKEHKNLWNIVTEILKTKVPAERFGPTQEKMDMFMNGAGTILFFEDDGVVEGYKEQFATYASAFDMFAAHGIGILQGNVWNALAEKHIGANLQHYNPIIDEKVKAEWNIPDGWRLVSQMVFGKIESDPEEKEKIPGENRVRVFE